MTAGLRRKIGEGNEVVFWKDNWLGSGTLKEKFGRLFNLSTRQHHVIKDLGGWVNGLWCWELHWRRPLLDREVNMVTDLLNFVSNLSLTEGISDDWTWTLEDGGLFSVKSAYSILQGDVIEPIDKIYSKLWSLKAPSNVLSLAWRVLKNRIQSKENLEKKKENSSNPFSHSLLLLQFK